MFSYRFTGIVMGCLITGLFSVATVSAQTSEDQYRASLINIIYELQEQIIELQLQLQLEASSVESTAGILQDIEGEVVASYTVDQQEISSRAPRAYQAYFERLLSVLPDGYDDHIDELVVFTGGNDDIAAYVETKVPYTKDWRYAVRESEIREDPESEVSTELMVHEFAHIFSIDQIFAEGRVASRCHSYFADQFCPGQDSYLGEFIETFWTTRMLDELESVQSGSRFNQTDFYEKYESDFVSEYAATDPAEDFAESFTWYVYGEMAPRGTVADQKIEFFDRFSYTQSLADEINRGL